MTEQLITEIQRKMLPYLNNEQLMHLRDAMTATLVGATITYDSGSIPAEETDAVEAFITAKRIEGCSEKTLSYYRKTIEALIAGVGKAVRQITTDDLRRYLTSYQVQRRSSKVTIDNIRRILSSFFSMRSNPSTMVIIIFSSTSLSIYIMACLSCILKVITGIPFLVRTDKSICHS